ncbi:MAG: helix-turn-helix domain-containing protein [Proteobacteria bacterium]|nr:helix-turn-helix domain-containing protein [Pseudomonadota bacterium]
MTAAENYSIRGNRLAKRLDEIGMSQAELARRIGIKQPSIAALISGKSQTTRHLHRIARELQTTPEFLTGEDDDVGMPAIADGRRSFRAQPPPLDEHALAELGLIGVKEVDLTLGAGGTYLDDRAVAETRRYFHKDWLREFTDAPPDMLVFARVKGDSMKPTLLDGAIVIIDLRRKRINEQNEVWSVAVADIGMVKRIWANPDGSYKINSDNPAVGPETAHDDEMYVIGRVVASIGKH